MGIKKQLTKIFTEVLDKEKVLTGTLYIKEKACNRRQLSISRCVFMTVSMSILRRASELVLGTADWPSSLC